MTSPVSTDFWTHPTPPPLKNFFTNMLRQFFLLFDPPLKYGYSIYGWPFDPLHPIFRSRRANEFVEERRKRCVRLHLKRNICRYLELVNEWVANILPPFFFQILHNCLILWNYRWRGIKSVIGAVRKLCKHLGELSSWSAKCLLY